MGREGHCPGGEMSGGICPRGDVQEGNVEMN